jgi:predicted nuclease of restriction endonuclease-like (RecB) superfamily
MKDNETKVFYIVETIENGRARRVLTHQIGTKLPKRIGRATTNFTQALPAVKFDSAEMLDSDN